MKMAKLAKTCYKMRWIYEKVKSFGMIDGLFLCNLYIITMECLRMFYGVEQNSAQEQF
jgi:hypothetical protein